MTIALGLGTSVFLSKGFAVFALILILEHGLYSLRLSRASDGHVLLVLGDEKVVDLLDILIVDLLQFELCILLIILGEAVLDGPLQLVLDVATHIAHLDLCL